ncbi:MAG: hypothetical protein ACRD2C_01220 [Acidimicrobiales bacterium]
MLLSCGGDADDDTASGYSADMRDEFVDECADAGTDRDVCGCLYDVFEAEVPYERFDELDDQLRSGEAVEVPTDVEAMAVGCAADPDGPSSADG